MRVGIAISLYDKFEELAILIDIIRKNWKGKYIISVCSNHPNPWPHLKDLDIDVFTKGDDIKISPDMYWMRRSINMRSRVTDCIKKSCTGAIKAGADYVMHLHTDAWPFKEKEVLKIIDYMKKHKKELAVRGMGFSKYRHDCPIGHVDDMFLLFNSKAMKKKNFFGFNTVAMLPHKLSTHGILSMLMVSKIGLENIYHYEDHTGQVFWDNKPHPGDLERGKPSMYDPIRGMLHVHTGSFPGNLGLSVQAMYLHNQDTTKGEHIQNFLNKYLMDKKILLGKLARIEKKLNFRLRLSGFPKLELGRFGRTFSKKQKYLTNSLKNKAKYWIGSTTRAIWENHFKYSVGLELTPAYSFWPLSLDSLFARYFEKKDYPVLPKIWFKKDKSIGKLPKFYGGFKEFW